MLESRTILLPCFVAGCLAILAMTAGSARAQDTSVTAAPAVAPMRTLVVGTKPIPPFVVQNADGTFSGISIDLWKRVAEQLDIPYTIRVFEVRQLLEPDHNGIDVVVSVNISASNEAAMDVTHAFYSTGLAIATRPESKSGVMAILSTMISANFVKGLGVLAGVLLIMGIWLWYIERHTKPEEFGGSAVKGIAHGVFWAFESLVGKAGALSKTRAARILILLWTYTCMLFVSGVTAKLSSELTVSQLTSSVSGPNDLPQVTVGTVRPSLATHYLDERGIAFIAFPAAARAMDALVQGRVDAVVYEAPILQYHANRTYPGRATVLPGTFWNHGYGFGLRTNSDLRERINTTMLRIVEGEDWKQILQRYTGSASN